jgi:hypothetical protein
MLTNLGLGYVFGDIFTNSSVHPEVQRLVVEKATDRPATAKQYERLYLSQSEERNFGRVSPQARFFTNEKYNYCTHNVNFEVSANCLATDRPAYNQYEEISPADAHGWLRIGKSS